MNLLAKKESSETKSQADLIFEANQRKELQFKANVAISWMVLILILIFLFSGQKLSRHQDHQT